MRVDIIIANHNYGRYLGDAIDSALAQTRAAGKVIVVDDGSTDQSRDVLARYRDRVSAVFQANAGQAAALNAGFASSTGDAIIFLDADDRLMPDLLERVADAFASRPGASRIHYPMDVIDKDGRPTGARKPQPPRVLPEGDLRRQALAFPFDQVWMATSGNAFSAGVLRRIMPIPLEYGVIGADWYLVHVSALYGPVGRLDRAGACYRVHDANRYEQADDRWTLAHLRQSIDFAGRTTAQLRRAAQELDLSDRPAEILSVSDIGNRMISLRQDPDGHPVPSDTRFGLLDAGLRAAARRSDSSLMQRLAFSLWFVLICVAPQPLVGSLADGFMNPGSWRPLRAILSPTHRETI